jgi:hypothetical protein
VPVRGATKPHRLEEDTGATDSRLSTQNLGVINASTSKITVHGARLPESEFVAAQLPIAFIGATANLIWFQ